MFSTYFCILKYFLIVSKISNIFQLIPISLLPVPGQYKTSMNLHVTVLAQGLGLGSDEDRERGMGGMRMSTTTIKNVNIMEFKKCNL